MNVTYVINIVFKVNSIWYLIYIEWIMPFIFISYTGKETFAWKWVCLNAKDFYFIVRNEISLCPIWHLLVKI